MRGQEGNDPLWAGRLAGGLDPAVLAFSSSLEVDRRLLPFDVAASTAHVEMLARQGILESADAQRIVDALGGIAVEPEASDEDVHSLIERHVVALLGDTGRRVHAGRSRNDQVAVAFRLWCRAYADGLARAAADLQEALIDRAVRANTRASASLLRHGSQILEHLVEEDGLLVVGAEYSLATGEVDFFDGIPD